jgi:hypothetical protein
MMSNTKHTPTPWAAGGSVIEREGETIAQAFRMTGCPIDQPVVNAAFIVRAVNSHEQLVAALRDLLPDAIGNHIGGPDTQARIDAARAALAAAEA